MSSRIITVSLVLNLALLAVVAWLVSNLKKEEQAAANRPEPETIYITNTVKQIEVRKIGSSNFWATLAATQKPSWSMLESTNYVNYIENLRSIGCPEETIQDIIIADVAKNYSKKRAALRAAAPAPPYWKPERDWKKTAEGVAVEQQVAALDLEEKALVKQLLDVDLQTELAKFDRADEMKEGEVNLSFLPEEKRKKVVDLEEQIDKWTEAVYREANGIILPADEERVRKLKKQRDEELAKILTPDEMQDYLMRKSNTAVMLREQMASFDVTEEEFKKIFKVQKVFDDQFGEAFDVSDPQQIEIRMKAEDEARKALEGEIKRQLGDSRYSEYHRAQDPDYTTLTSMAERFGGTRDMAARVYDMKQEAERQKQALEANPRLTQEQREAGLAALAKETQRQVAQTLGGNSSQMWKAYQQTGAQYWLDALAVSQVAPEPEPVETAPTPVYPFPVPPMPPMPIP